MKFIIEEHSEHKEEEPKRIYLQADTKGFCATDVDICLDGKVVAYFSLKGELVICKDILEGEGLRILIL